MIASRDTEVFQRERRRMIEEQLRSRGIHDERVLEAMFAVPRHVFVDDIYQLQAYEDHPLPIGAGQTISQPYMVALMTELCALTSTDRVLEVGAGSGYQSAILARLAKEVFAAEIVAELAQRASTVLRELDFQNVVVEHRDASSGWPEAAPYDAILVAAGAPEVPPPLLEQLAEGGRLVIPVGRRDVQTLLRLSRRHGELIREQDTPCRFVDLRGRHGWDRETYS